MTASATSWRKPRCASRKAAYRSQGEAQRVLTRIAVSEAQAAAPEEKYPRNAYKCRCGAWHLTSQEQRTEVTPRKARKAIKRGRARKRPTAPRHLTVVPAPKPALALVPPVKPEPVAFKPSDRITPKRRRLWDANEADYLRARAAELGITPIHRRTA